MVGGLRMVNVVVVEDDEMILKLVSRALDAEDDITLRRSEIGVTTLMNEAAWRDVDVAIVDLLLPGTVGDELIRWLAAHAPHVRRIAVSGAGESRLAEATDAHVNLLKPFMIDELLTAIRATS